MADFQRTRRSRTWRTAERGLSWTARDGATETTSWADIASARVSTDRLVIRPRPDGPRLVLPQAQDQPPSAFVADLLRLLPHRLLEEDVRTFLDIRSVSTRSFELAAMPHCPTCGGPWERTQGDMVGASGPIEVELVDEPHRHCPACTDVAPIDADQVGEIVNQFTADDALARPVEQWAAGIEVTATSFLTGRVTRRYRARLVPSDEPQPAPPTFGALAGAVLDAFGGRLPRSPQVCG